MKVGYIYPESTIVPSEYAIKNALEGEYCAIQQYTSAKTHSRPEQSDALRTAVTESRRWGTPNENRTIEESGVPLPFHKDL